MEAIKSILQFEFILFITLATFSTVVGWYLVAGLRLWTQKSSNLSALSYLPIISPVLFYGIFSLLYHAGIISSAIGDCATLFIMIGIIFRLSVKSKAKATIRLAINQKDSDIFTDILLNSDDISVGEARNLIAQALQVPSSRINIESGKGSYLKEIDDDNNIKFLPLIGSVDNNRDLFGFCTVPCFVTISEEEPVISSSKRKSSSALTRVFPTLSSEGSSKETVKYGSDIYIHGKIPNSTNDAKAFSFSVINNFAAVAPSVGSMRLSNATQAHAHDMVRLVSWHDDLMPGTPSISRAQSFEKSLSGEKVKNNQQIVIEKNGKFMSVSKGWYVAWESDKPRRSGAFIVEIVKKAPQSILGQGKEKLKEKILHQEKEDADVLRVGDTFRLRSVKFPAYELGVTSVRLKDDNFHVGLRKIEDDLKEGKTDWALPLHLTAKLH